MESYNKENTIFSDILFREDTTFSAGLNKQPVKNFLNNINNCTVSFFDFWYKTKLHDKSAKVVFQVIDSCFNGRDKQFVKVETFAERWANKETKWSILFHNPCSKHGEIATE